MKSERENDKGEPNVDQLKDLDLNTLSTFGSVIDLEPDMKLIVTGSYATEALTEVSAEHEDMDTNIFCLDIEQQKNKVASLIEELSIPNVSITLFREKEDRLAYDIQTGQHEPRRLEIQFVEVTEIDEDSDSFQLKSGGIVPTSIMLIKDSKGEESKFRVKSLPYAIATWVIRTSGVAENAKRPVRESDYTQLMQLLSRNYSDDEVFMLMAQHPQMPAEMSAETVFTELMKKLKGK